MPDDTRAEQAAEERERKRREKREALLALLLAALILTTEDHLRDGAAALGAGKIDAAGFGALLVSALPGAHAQAAMVGRQWAGDLTPFNEADAAFGASVAQGQALFVSGFVSDIQAGKLSDAQVSARAALYAHRLYGTAQEAWLANIPPDTLLEWHTDPLAAHCETGLYGSCPDLAGKGKMRADAWPCEPGDGSTQCNTRCRCWFSWEGGTGPRVPEWH